MFSLHKRRKFVVFILALLGVFIAVWSLSGKRAGGQLTPQELIKKDQSIPLQYTKNQVNQGKKSYEKNCSACHGAGLNDGSAPPLIGPGIEKKWYGKSVGEMVLWVEENMPPGQAGELDRNTYIQILTYLFDSSSSLSKKGNTPMSDVSAYGTDLGLC